MSYRDFQKWQKQQSDAAAAKPTPDATPQALEPPPKPAPAPTPAPQQTQPPQAQQPQASDSWGVEWPSGNVNIPTAWKDRFLLGGENATSGVSDYAMRTIGGYDIPSLNARLALARQRLGPAQATTAEIGGAELNPLQLLSLAPYGGQYLGPIAQGAIQEGGKALGRGQSWSDAAKAAEQGAVAGVGALVGGRLMGSPAVGGTAGAGAGAAISHALGGDTATGALVGAPVGSGVGEFMQRTAGSPLGRQMIQNFILGGAGAMRDANKSLNPSDYVPGQFQNWLSGS